VAEETELQERLAAMQLRFVPVDEATVWHLIPPDRCSPEWALGRSYRHGLTQGIQWTQKGGQPALLGAPRWVWRSIAEFPVRWVFDRSREGRRGGFRQLLILYHSLGILKGSRAELGSEDE
jgi:hypothetical protein